MAGKPQQKQAGAETKLFPIRTVATLTGVNPITLRAWERRYGLIKPIRTPGGHRVYTRADIDDIHSILALLAQGIAVSQVGEALPSKGRGERASREGKSWQRYRERMAAAIAQFDENRLEEVYNEALSDHPMQRVTREVLMPLLRHLGERWQESAGAIAEEHFFAMYLRNKLGARFHHRGRGAAGPKLVVACLPGEVHEVGMLLFALAAHERGFRLVLLGADTPLGELSHAVLRARAAVIILSGSIDPAAAIFDNDLPKLVREVGVPVFVGGAASVRHRDGVVKAGAEPLGNEIDAALGRIEDRLGVKAINVAASPAKKGTV
jgi:DNA-binding transcriptional MerR regulator/methylmalonyl-CoA mutase cobalamin-binding subunit